MPGHWGDLNVRSRGLATHLIPRAQLERLAQSGNLGTLVAGLARGGVSIGESPHSVNPMLLDRAARRPAAAALRVLQRWSGPRGSALAVLFEDEERRSIRRLLRGAVQGAASEHRIAGLLPTANLPERALWELARQPDTRGVAAVLATWRHPYADVLLPEAARAHPDLLILEASVNRRFAERVLRGARRGDKWLERYAQQVIDIENAWTALLLVNQPDLAPDQVFVNGGRVLHRAVFDRTVGSDPKGTLGMLEQVFAAPPLALEFRTGGDPSRLEITVLRQQISQQQRKRRLEPLSAAPLIEFVLRLRAQILDLRRIIWGIALGAPAAVVSADLVTPP